MVHPPATQLVPVGHTTPHAPQLERSALTSRSQPLAVLPSQSPKPAAHAKPHVLARHATTELGGGVPVHARPHIPQLAGSVASVAQRPEQSVVPVAQVVPQRPPEQTVPIPQAAPQRPQLALSLRRLRSQPFEATLSQSPKSVAHTKRHVPAVQVPESA